MSAHTPGPWTPCFSFYDNEIVGFHIAASPHGSTKPVCESDPKTDPETLEANAHLIAAAPAMLKALKALDLVLDFDMPADTCACFPQGAGSLNEAMEMAKAAIEQATPEVN